MINRFKHLYCKRPRLVIVIAFFLINIIGYTIYAIIGSKYYAENWHTIKLENVHASIPLRMWDPDNDEVYISDHMFRITDNDGNYIIYATQLELYDTDDEKYGIFYAVDDGLINYDSEYQLCKGIKNSSDVLANVLSTKADYKHGMGDPPYYFYMIKGEAGGEFSGYNTYISTSKRRLYPDKRFIFVLLYKDPEQLSQKEEDKMWQWYISEYNGWSKIIGSDNP
ncbi:MAG: hypothetical protein K6G27_02815 [Lachnospiraceae bacterium]|nr:hypothetical protein [Lachnospiraceae bacterium]